ncbi:MAG: hypothetical protein ACI9AT_002425 [Ulvibacter sp.]|jgi:hypothetical protein
MHDPTEQKVKVPTLGRKAVKPIGQWDSTKS